MIRSLNPSKGFNGVFNSNQTLHLRVRDSEDLALKTNYSQEIEARHIINR